MKAKFIEALSNKNNYIDFLKIVINILSEHNRIGEAVEFVVSRLPDDERDYVDILIENSLEFDLDSSDSTTEHGKGWRVVNMAKACIDMPRPTDDPIHKTTSIIAGSFVAHMGYMLKTRDAETAPLLTNIQSSQLYRLGMALFLTHDTLLTLEDDMFQHRPVPEPILVTTYDWLELFLGVENTKKFLERLQLPSLSD